MKLATLRDGTRDGALIVVDRTGERFASARSIAKTMQAALDAWDAVEPKLRALAAELEAGKADAAPLDPARLGPPLPRAYQWVDGSAYINHIVLVRKARGAEPPATLKTDPLMYQGGSDSFLAPTEDIPVGDVAWGVDFESEVAVIVDDVPMGVTPEQAAKHIQLVMICNDVSLRNLIPAELEKGFGFLVSK